MGFAVEFLVYGRIIEPKVSGEINHLGTGIQQASAYSAATVVSEKNNFGNRRERAGWVP